MKNVLTSTKPFFLAALLIIFIGATSWQVSPKSKIESKQSFTDTIKPNNNTSDKDEFGIDELDKAMKELEVQMKKMEAEFKNGKIDEKIREAMKKIDMKKIQAEIEASMKKVDWNKIQAEVDKAMKGAELTMKKVDMSKMEEEMKQLQEKMKSEDFHFKMNTEKIHQKVEESMQKAKVQMQKAKEEIRFMNEFTGELEKDGLINKKKGYRIEVKDGELYINGAKQSKEISDKYRRYYKKDNFTINTNGDSIISL